MPNTTRNTLIASDWYDNNFLMDFLHRDSEFKVKMNQKTKGIERGVVSPRVMNHWVEKGLIDEDRDRSVGWRKFSVSEAIWINIIINLRKFGFGIEQLLNVKKYLKFFSTETNQSRFPELDFYIGICVFSKKEVKMLVFQNGQTILGTEEEINTSLMLGSIIDDYIILSLNKLIDVVFRRERLSKKTAIESYVQNVLKESHSNDDLKNMSIKFSTKDYFVRKETKVKSIQEAERIISKSENAEILIGKRNGHRYYRVVEKIKIVKK